jgi:hypothetical protein
LHFHYNTFLAVPGSEVCANFEIDRDVTNQPFDFGVFGANSKTASKIFTGNQIQFCYTTDRIGLDSLVTGTEFDYGSQSYKITADMLFESILPVLSVDETVHSNPDTLLIDPSDHVCAVFQLNQPVGNVPVSAVVRGANTADVERLTDMNGRVVACYSATVEGVDTVTATAFFDIGGVAFETAETLVATVVDGSGVLPSLVAEIDPGETGTFRSRVELNSDKQLAGISANYWFTWSGGGPVTNTLQFEHVQHTTWSYRAEYLVTGAGRLDVAADAVDAYGNESRIVTSYDVGIVRRYQALDFRTLDATLRLSEPSRLTRWDGALAVTREDDFEDSPADTDGNPLVPVSQRFDVKTSARFEIDPVLSLRYDYRAPGTPDPDRDARKIGLYRRTEDGWTHVGGEGSGGRVSAPISEMGEYAAFFNAAYSVVPAATALYQNYPNPFNPATKIVFELAAERNIDVVVYSVTGARVRTLAGGLFPAGIHTVEWDGLDETGSPAASGVYFYRLITGDYSETKKMVLIR